MNTLLIIGLVLVAPSVIWFGAGYGIERQNQNKTPYLIFIPLLMLWVGIMLIVIHAENKYKQGQIDYHNGIIKYELKTNPDSTVTWEEVQPTNIK